MHPENVNTIVDWLTIPLDNGVPRFCELYRMRELYRQIYTAIRQVFPIWIFNQKYFQQFLAATNQSTFAVDMILCSYEEREFAEFHLENGIGEQLDGKWTMHENVYNQVFQITRHRADRSTLEIREWIMAMTKGREDRKIWILNPTVG